MIADRKLIILAEQSVTFFLIVEDFSTHRISSLD